MISLRAPIRRLRNGITYANLVATAALIFALGGVSYAALALPARSVGPAQLRPGAVRTQALGVALGGNGTENPDPTTFLPHGSIGPFGVSRAWIIATTAHRQAFNT
jgi:hypothetical protein